MLGSGSATDTMVDLATGLPIQIVAGVPDPSGRRFVAGYNAEIRRAKLAGEVHVDLRPFLMTSEAVAALFRAGPSHVLAPKCAIDLVGGSVRYEVFVPRRPKTAPRFRPTQEPYVRRVDENGRHFVMGYEGSPIPVVVGAGEETVALEMPSARLLFHVQTGALLHRFRR